MRLKAVHRRRNTGSRLYFAIAPDLYRGKVTDNPMVARQLMQGMPMDRAIRDLKANVDALVSSDSATFWNEWRGRWIGVRLDRITLRVLRELIADAWLIAAPKRLATRLKHSPSAA